MEEVAAAVIEQAAIDYYNLVKDCSDSPDDFKTYKVKRLKKVIKFFKSEWYDELATLCNFRISGIDVMKILNKKVEDNIPIGRKMYA